MYCCESNRRNWHNASMAEHHLNVITVRLREYTGHPLPENLDAETTLQVNVGAQVDLEQLIDEIREDIGRGPRRVRQSITETSWGASGSGAEIIIDVPTILTGLASLPVLWDTIFRRILRRGQARMPDVETQAENARAWLAQSLGIGADAIKIVGLEPSGDSHNVELETPETKFLVEINSQGVTRMRKS
jgi:hypothetical protein